MSYYRDREVYLPESSLSNAYAREPFYADEAVRHEDLANDGVERCGVGVLLLPDSEGAVRVMGLAQGSPAERCGRIQKGDILAEVDGVVVYKQPLEEFGERISGPMYSHVELVFYGNEEKSFKYRVELQRLATLQAPSSIPEPQFATDQSGVAPASPHAAAANGIKVASSGSLLVPAIRIFFHFLFLI